MKTVLAYGKKLLIHACVTYTILTLLLFLIGAAFPEMGDALQIKDMLAIFGFGILLGGANLFLSMEKFAFPLRLAFHFPASLLAFSVVFVLIGAKAEGPTVIIPRLLLFTVLYAIVMGVYILLSHTIKTARAKDYKKQYE